jgi:predicted PurR-regulated permease PerM
MSERSAKKLFPNPFYVALLLASTLFVLTILAYLIGPTIQEQAVNQARAGKGPGAGALGTAAWLDRNGPLALGIELLVMLLSGLLAMATDRWFPERPEPNPPPTRSA